MKNILGIITALFCAITLNGQVEYLRLSPSQKIIQRVGATDVEIEFSRPQMKGRVVFGELVPYGKLWRTGANENTKISFNHRVKIGETEVSQGTYALITKPKRKSWDIFLYTDTNNLDVPNPIDSTKLIHLTTVESYQLENLQETLVLNFYDLTETSANLGISWERTAVKIPILFYTREAMEKMIEEEFKKNIFDYSIAAAYYSQRDIELEKAKELQELSMNLRDKPSAWAYNDYGKILQKLGEIENAIEAFQFSLKLSKESKNEYLIAENTRSLNELKE